MSPSEMTALLGGVAAVSAALGGLVVQLRGSGKDRIDRQTAQDRWNQLSSEQVVANLTSRLAASEAECERWRDKWASTYTEREALLTGKLTAERERDLLAQQLAQIQKGPQP